MPDIAKGVGGKHYLKCNKFFYRPCRCSVILTILLAGDGSGVGPMYPGENKASIKAKFC